MAAPAREAGSGAGGRRSGVPVARSAHSGCSQGAGATTWRGIGARDGRLAAALGAAALRVPAVLGGGATAQWAAAPACVWRQCDGAVSGGGLEAPEAARCLRVPAWLGWAGWEAVCQPRSSAAGLAMCPRRGRGKAVAELAGSGGGHLPAVFGWLGNARVVTATGSPGGEVGGDGGHGWQ